MLSADGRADIDSKRTSYQRSHAKLGETFQLGVDQLASHLGLLHLHISPEYPAVMCVHLHRHDDAAQPAPSEEVYEAHKQTTKRTALVTGCTLNTCHMRSLLNLIHCGLGRFISWWSFSRSWARCSVLSSRFSSS